ncbi:hypothetical protein [Acaryochloris marina]|uniref:hypothetical protein n=1 Tax=Acaryochloris marina TaxID=155978 RepID=UPI0021C4A4D0|nr:hypothetical protein [Acaryochloris marina]
MSPLFASQHPARPKPMCEWTKEDFAKNSTRLRIPFADFRECGVEITSFDVAFRFDRKVDLEAINKGPVPGEIRDKSSPAYIPVEEPASPVSAPVAVAGPSFPLIPVVGIAFVIVGMGLVGLKVRNLVRAKAKAKEQEPA